MMEELVVDIIHSLWMNNNSLSYIMKVLDRLFTTDGRMKLVFINDSCYSRYI
jgi:hypothetical protein